MGYITAVHITLETICSHTCQHRIARVQESYRAREHPPENTAVNSETTADASANSNTLRNTKEKRGDTHSDNMQQRSTTSCKPNQSCTVVEVVVSRRMETREASRIKEICRLTA